MTNRIRSTTTTPDGIKWYYEQEGSGPHVILIPDGIGDCQAFDKAISSISGAGFTVTTFDTPGMSRSSDTPAEAFTNVTGTKLAKQVIGLLDQLSIPTATFWGSSSGGATVLALVSLYPSRVRSALAHEVPSGPQPALEALLSLDDDAISSTLSENVPRIFPMSVETWTGMGQEYHARLWKNYPRWARGYLGVLPQNVTFEEEELKKRPVDWSVGGETPMRMFMNNVVAATKFGINLTVLAGSHLPYISHPEDFSRYIVERTRAYL